MRRVNIKDAFVGKQTSTSDAAVEGQDEAVILSIRGGELIAVAPTGTAEDEVVSTATLVHGTLRLENDRVLTFEIRREGNASFEDSPGELPRSAHHLPAGEHRPSGHRSGSGRTQTAEEIMSRDVLVASPDMLVEDIAKQLAFHNITGMPVEDGAGDVVGIVSEADVIGKIGTIVADVMSTEVISVSTTTPVEQIASLMGERRIRRVPVMSGGALVGIVSRADIVRAYATLG